MNIGEQIEQRRKELGMSRRKLSLESGISEVHLFNIEKGSTDIKVSTLNKILRVLNLTIKIDE